MDIDISFDVRSDVPLGTDPDKYSTRTTITIRIHTNTIIRSIGSSNICARISSSLSLSSSSLSFPEPLPPHGS